LGRAPLARSHCRASLSFSESLRRLAPGFSAINRRIEVTSSVVTTRPRYLHSEAICRQCGRVENGTQVLFVDFFKGSTAATPAALLLRDCRQRAVAEPDARVASVPLPCRLATISNCPWTNVLRHAKTTGRRTPKR